MPKSTLIIEDICPKNIYIILYKNLRKLNVVAGKFGFQLENKNISVHGKSFI